MVSLIFISSLKNWLTPLSCLCKSKSDRHCDIHSVLASASVAGLVDLKISQTLPDTVANLISVIGSALNGFYTSKEQPLLKALKLWRAISSPLKKATMLSERDMHKFPIIKSISEALSCLEGVIQPLTVSFIQDCVQKHGQDDLKGAYKTLNSSLVLTELVPTCVAKLSLTLCAAGSTSDDEALSLTSIPTSEDALQKYLPVYVKLQGLDTTLLESVSESRHKKIVGFCTLFESSLTTWREKRRKTMDGCIAKLAPYRLGGVGPIVISILCIQLDILFFMVRREW